MKRTLAQLAFLFFLAALPRTASAQQQLVPVCIVSAAQNATLGGTNLSVGSTAFSGDLLATGDNGQLQLQCKSVRFTLAANTSSRVFQLGARIIVELEKGTLMYADPGDSLDLTLYSQDLRIVPQTSQPAMGEIHVPNRCHIDVKAIKSTIDVTSGRETKTIEETKSYEVTSEIGVEYRDSWKPVERDYPEYPRDAEYHHSHGHVACAAAAAPQSARPPLQALGEGHFKELVIGIGAIFIIPPIIKALESPDRPQ
jgi:hypothetical protein